MKAIGLTQPLLALLVPGTRPFNTSPDGFVIDSFRGGIFNDLAAWHGSGEDMPLNSEDGYIRLFGLRSRPLHLHVVKPGNPSSMEPSQRRNNGKYANHCYDNQRCHSSYI